MLQTRCPFRPNYMVDAVPRCSAAQRTASRRPFGTSTASQMIRLDARHIENRNGKPCQVLPVLSMIAWITFGPTIDDARFVNPNKPKNCTPQGSPPRSEVACAIAICGLHAP